jgi:tetratricopeptide (TPR) repeat protein
MSGVTTHDDTATSTEIRRLVAEARAATAADRVDAALSAWRRIAELDPAHPEAAFRLGSLALVSGDPARAVELLRIAAAGSPREPLAAHRLAMAHRALGDSSAELAALDDALSIQPYFLAALLQKADLQQRRGQARTAARTWRNALKIAPPEAQWPADLRAALEKARAAVAADLQALDEHLRDAVGEAAGRAPARFVESLAILAGRKRAFVHEPVLLHYPQLPAVPFHERALFPWLERLEAAAADIRGELLAVLEGDGGEFRPYVRYAPGTPLNQWAELNYSPRWSSYYLWRNGAPVDEHCRRCPKTAEVLASLPLARIDGTAPVAMFSALTARTRIPPHTGETNARAIVHLPLIVPAGCGFRVGNEVREWREGEAWVFDDSIEHEAWNDSDHLRVILILDVWNPYLSAAETAGLGTAFQAYHAYYRESD